MDARRILKSCKMAQTAIWINTILFLVLFIQIDKQNVYLKGLALAAVIFSVPFNTLVFIHYKTLKSITELKTDFLAITSHEVKNPLTAVILQLGLLKRDPTGITKETLVKIEEQLNRAIQLLNSSLDVTLEDQLKLDQLDIIPIIQEITTLYPNTQLCFPRDPVFVNINETRFRQIIHNLLVNAQKYGKGESIEVGIAEIFQAGSFFARITVTDHGIGMSRTEIQKLFTHIQYRGKSDQKGHGIGFYVIKNLVQAHDGFIGLSSEPNKGTSFVINLPISHKIAV